MHFTRQRALLSEVARMENEVVTLQTNIPPSLLPYLDSASAVSIGLTQPTSVPQSTPGAVQPVQTTQALAPSTGHRGSKRGRTPRGSSNAPPRKRMAAVTGPPNNKSSMPVEMDPKKQEEIERRIQDIVQKALSVDNAAKSAEKERKAKNADKKKLSRVHCGRPSASVLSATDLVTGSSQNLVPTFSSPGLVPVPAPLVSSAHLMENAGLTEGEYVSESEHRQRNRSGSSTETESAPSDQEIGHAKTLSSLEDKRFQTISILSRPSSVPVSSKTAQNFRIANLVGSESTGSLDSAGPPSRAQSAFPHVQGIR